MSHSCMVCIEGEGEEGRRGTRTGAWELDCAVEDDTEEGQ